jgi:hypothetical protein
MWFSANSANKSRCCDEVSPQSKLQLHWGFGDLELRKEKAMKIPFWFCEKCGTEIDVEPIETSQYRGITCESCGAVFSVLNSELRIKEGPGSSIPPSALTKDVSVDVLRRVQNVAAVWNTHRWQCRFDCAENLDQAMRALLFASEPSSPRVEL